MFVLLLRHYHARVIMPLTCYTLRVFSDSFCHLDSEGKERKEDEEEEENEEKGDPKIGFRRKNNCVQ